MTTPTETLTRSQAHRKLLALGMPANVVTHVLDHPDELLHLFSPMPTVVPSKEAVAIVAAYQRHCKGKVTTDPLEGVPPEERAALPVNSIGTCLLCDYHGPGPGHDCKPRVVLTPAEEASAPGQTPIGRPPSLITTAFEAILWFLECVIGPLRPRKITPAEEIGALAACEVETDFEPDEPPDALIKLRDLVTRAAEEHARGPVPPGFAEYEAHLAATATPAQKASAERWAGGAERVTEEELAEIEARTSGPGPLAGDGELLRRCRAEIVSLRAALTHEQHEHRIKASLYEMALKDIERLEAEIKSLRTHDRGDLL